MFKVLWAKMTLEFLCDQAQMALSSLYELLFFQVSVNDTFLFSCRN